MNVPCYTAAARLGFKRRATKRDSSEKKVIEQFFLAFFKCSLPMSASKNIMIGKIGKRWGKSYPTYALALVH